MNEKMQPKTKVSHRRWQHFNQGEYYYGECPKCGAVAQPDFEQPTEEDHVRGSAPCFWGSTTAFLMKLSYGL